MIDRTNDNRRIFDLMSVFLNLSPDAVKASDAIKQSETFGISVEYAYAQLLATYCCLDLLDSESDKRFFKQYFLPMVHMLKASEFRQNPYYANIVIPDVSDGKWDLKHERLSPGEAFVCNDPLVAADGRLIPQIGFFTEEFVFPAVLENGREWMTLMPNETVTSKEAVDGSFGKVLTYGLGLGYFAYMASQKSSVSSVTVVEKDKSVIELFKAHLLNQFPNKNKITVVCADAFEYAENNVKNESFDFIFTDIWHDPSDGVALYKKMKEYERFSPGSKYVYWLEKTLKLYME